MTTTTALSGLPDCSISTACAPEVSFILADYLDQHLRRTRATVQPQNSVWSAALAHPLDPLDIVMMAGAAHERGRLAYASRLYQRVEDSEEDWGPALASWAWGALIRLRAQVGDEAGAAEAVLRYPQGDEKEPPWRELAMAHIAAGNLAAAEDAARQAQAAGDGLPWVQLALVRERAGDRDGVEAVAREVGEVSAFSLWSSVADMRASAGDLMEAAAASLIAGRDGGVMAALPSGWRSRSAELLERAGRRDLAEEVARAAATGHEFVAWERLAERRERNGDRPAAENAVREAIAAGDHRAWTRCAEARMELGDLVGAADALVEAARAGEPETAVKFAEVMERTGEREVAEAIARDCAANGDPSVWFRLAVVRVYADDDDAAGDAVRQASAAGDRHAVAYLTEVREYGARSEKCETAPGRHEVRAGVRSGPSLRTTRQERVPQQAKPYPSATRRRGFGFPLCESGWETSPARKLPRPRRRQ